ncbi:MAG TPA: hypothetical protein VFV10_17785 [Gammaproteobacteria bacterium]|nr:hypothetical protein [Gammaproteobacteria bacterium]
MIHPLKAGLAIAALSLAPAAVALAGDLLFTAQEAAVIKAYYASHPPGASRSDAGPQGSSPTGRAVSGSDRSVVASHAAGGGDHVKGRAHKHGRGRGDLPPGIAKNLARGKPLPPGIAMQTLPPDLVERLPPAPAGCERIVVDGKVVLVDAATRVVHDILADAVDR